MCLPRQVKIEDWARDQARRDKARVPATIAFQTKPEIAFEQIKAARTAGLPQGVVLMDAGRGNDTVRWTPKMRQLAKVEPCP